MLSVRLGRFGYSHIVNVFYSLQAQKGVTLTSSRASYLSELNKSEKARWGTHP